MLFIVIVGAGPTGLAAANLLGTAGIETLVIERNAGLSDCPKAISIDDEGLRICQAMGLCDALLAHALLGIDAHYLSGRHFLARVSPQSKRNGFPPISTFHQPELEAILLRGLDRFAHVKVLFQHTLEDFTQNEQGIQVTIRTPAQEIMQVACTYLLACDGGRSFIRHKLGIPLQSPGFLPVGGFSASQQRLPRTEERSDNHAQRWLVVDCINDEASSRAATFFCNPARPAVTVPAPYERRRWEFMLLPGEREEDLLQEHTILAFIKQTRRLQGLSEQTLQTLQAHTHIARHAIYTFHAALATTFSSGRIFLLGDAAHMMPPFGGQGMNSGLRDAHNLCWKLQMVLEGRMPPRILDSYHQERYPHTAQMILFSWLLGKIVMPTSHLAAFLRDMFVHTIMLIPPINDALTQMRVKPQPRYKEGLFLSDGTRLCKKLVGQMLPQPPVLTQDGKRVLLDEVFGNGFALVRLYEEPQEVFSALGDEIWSRLSVRFVCVQPFGSSVQEVRDLQGVTAVMDVEGTVGKFLFNRRDLCVLVRPDRYVMGAFFAEHVSIFKRELEKLL